MKSQLSTVSFVTALALYFSPISTGVAQGRFRGAGPGGAAPSPTVDPATGLPLAPAEWKDPQWKDPDKTLSVQYEGVPVGEVARDLRKQFGEAFDIVIPGNSQPGNDAPEISDTPVRIQLKNVTASEVFNAMNLAFETENMPFRWELKMNGKRPTVVLRPMFVASRQTEPRRKIFFVGELTDDAPGGMTMEQLVKTVSEVYEMSYGKTQKPIANHLQFHKQAQLLIVTGSVDEISFVEETLTALRQKLERGRQVTVRPGIGLTKPQQPKAGSDASGTP